MLIELTYQGAGGVGLLERWDINAIPLNIASTFADLDRIRRAAQNYKRYPQFGSVFSYSNYYSGRAGRDGLPSELILPLVIVKYYNCSPSRR